METRLIVSVLPSTGGNQNTVHDHGHTRLHLGLVKGFSSLSSLVPVCTLMLVLLAVIIIHSSQEMPIMRFLCK